MVLLIKYTQVSHEHTEPMTHTHSYTLPPAFRMLYVCVPPQIRHETEVSFRKEDATLWLPKPKGSAVSQTRKLNPFHVHFFPSTPSIHAEITNGSQYVSKKNRPNIDILVASWFNFDMLLIFLLESLYKFMMA